MLEIKGKFLRCSILMSTFRMDFNKVLTNLYIKKKKEKKSCTTLSFYAKKVRSVSSFFKFRQMFLQLYIYIERERDQKELNRETS